MTDIAQPVTEESKTLEEEKQLMQDATTKAPYSPLPSQIVWIDTAMQLETDNISAIAEACNIDRCQWYRWMDKPGFIEWYEAEWNRRLKGIGWRLDVIGLKNARRDYNYWKSMQQRVGRLQEKNSLTQVNVSGDMSLEFSE